MIIMDSAIEITARTKQDWHNEFINLNFPNSNFAQAHEHSMPLDRIFEWIDSPDAFLEKYNMFHFKTLHSHDLAESYVRPAAAKFNNLFQLRLPLKELRVVLSGRTGALRDKLTQAIFTPLTKNGTGYFHFNSVIGAPESNIVDEVKTSRSPPTEDFYRLFFNHRSCALLSLEDKSEIDKRKTLFDLCDNQLEISDINLNNIEKYIFGGTRFTELAYEEFANLIDKKLK